MADTRRHVGPLALGLVAVAGAVGVGGAVAADGVDGPTATITFPATTIVEGQPGSIHQVGEADVAAAQVAQTCAVTVQTTNNVSPHPESDVLVDSGGSRVIASDVEAVPGGSTTATGTLTLGTTVTVSVMLGPDGVFSGGGTVSMVCSAVVPSTTSTTSTTRPPDVLPANTQQPAVSAEVVAQSAGAVQSTPSFTG